MILYGAGNFVLMSKEEKERQFMWELKKREYECNRLISFFFQKELKTVMNVNKGVNDAQS